MVRMVCSGHPYPPPYAAEHSSVGAHCALAWMVIWWSGYATGFMAVKVPSSILCLGFSSHGVTAMLLCDP